MGSTGLFDEFQGASLFQNRNQGLAYPRNEPFTIDVNTALVIARARKRCVLGLMSSGHKRFRAVSMTYYLRNQRDHMGPDPTDEDLTRNHIWIVKNRQWFARRAARIVLDKRSCLRLRGGHSRSEPGPSQPEETRPELRHVRDVGL